MTKGKKHEGAQDVAAHSKSKRIKERTIREIMMSISRWRQLHSGIMIVEDEVTGEVTQQRIKRMSLERASKEIGLTKKSLDDYLLQFRFGAKFGFDFELNIDQKMGVLRQYVKERKAEIKEGNGNQKISSKLSLEERQVASDRLERAFKSYKGLFNVKDFV